MADAGKITKKVKLRKRADSDDESEDVALPLYPPSATARQVRNRLKRDVDAATVKKVRFRANELVPDRKQATAKFRRID